MILDQIYNVGTVKNFADSAGQQFVSNDATRFADAGGTIALEHLTYIDPTILAQKYPGLAFWDCGVEISNVGGYVDRVKTLKTAPQGDFKNAGDNSSDKGLISIDSDSNTIKIGEREATANWTDSDVKSASLEGRNLPSEFISATDEKYKRAIDEEGLVGGIKSSAQEGILNYSGFTEDAASDTVADLSATALYDEFALFIDNQFSAVSNTAAYMANRLIVPTFVLNKFRRNFLNTAGGNMTVYEALKQNFNIEIYGSFRATTTATVFSNAKEVMQFRLPIPMEMSPVERIKFKFSFDTKYRSGGMDFLEDVGGRRLTGLA